MLSGINKEKEKNGTGSVGVTGGGTGGGTVGIKSGGKSRRSFENRRSFIGSILSGILDDHSGVPAGQEGEGKGEGLVLGRGAGQRHRAGQGLGLGQGLSLKIGQGTGGTTGSTGSKSPRIYLESLTQDSFHVTVPVQGLRHSSPSLMSKMYEKKTAENL